MQLPTVGRSRRCVVPVADSGCAGAGAAMLGVPPRVGGPPLEDVMNEPVARLAALNPLPAPAAPGMTLNQVDTPALLLDLDAFEHNLSSLSQSLRGTVVRVRPHAKSHKCPTIALRQ